MKNKLKKRSHISNKYKGMSFAEAAEKISNKYKNRDFDTIEKNSYQTEMKELMSLQDKAREVAEMSQYRNGGRLPKYTNGTPALEPLPLLPMKPVIPNMMASVPPGDNPFISMMDSQPKPEPPVITYDDQEPPVSLPLTIDNNFGMSTQKDAPKTKKEDSAFLPAYIGSGLSTILNAGILAQGPDKETPSDNPYESDIRRLLADRKINTTAQRNQILSSENAARANLNNVRSANVRNSLDANLMNISSDNLAQSQLAEQQANLALQGEYANMLNNLGQQKARASEITKDLNARNKGQFLSNLSAFGANIGESGKFFTEKKLKNIYDKMLGDILNSKYANVGLNPELLNRFKDGKLTPDDITVIKNIYGDDAEPLIKKFGE